jgi:hypothetical protein
VTVSQILRMVDDGYFVDGMGGEPKEETIPELNVDEAVLFDGGYCAGLRMPPHPMFSAILLKYQI